nr:C4-dicarboxylate TRAP transporter substrate-binding protein [Evansella caseinilytica]
MKKTLTLISILFMGVFLAACGSSQQSNDSDGGATEDYTLRLGITQNDQNAEYQALLQFKERVEERTDGAVKVETYHSDQLASVPDLIEQASVGTNVGTITDAAQLGDLKKEFSILQSPYMFDNDEQINKLLDSDLFQGWVEDFNKQGLQVLAFNFRLGERNLATKNKIESAQDLRGTVIRTSGAEIVNATVSAMGGSPTGMPWTEAYPSLQQGVIDGVEAHNSAIYGASMHEVINHVAKTRHYLLVSSLVVSADWFNSLPEEYQTIVLEEAREAGEMASKIAAEDSEEFEQLMTDAGVEFHEVDREEFRELTLDVFEKIGLSDIREAVNEVINQ